MAYNEDSIYVPRSYSELEQNLWLAYNLFLEQNGKNPITLQTFKNMNIKIANNTNLEFALQNDLLAGGLYDKMKSYFLANKESLQSNPVGSTVLGLTNALLALGFTEVAVFDPDSSTNNTIDGTIRIVIPELNQAGVNGRDLWDCIYKNKGAGVRTIGSVNITYNDDNNQSRTYSYDYINNNSPILLNVRLSYQYSTNYIGDRLTQDKILTNYINRFTEVVKVGQDIEPAYINDITYYPSLAFLDSEFSTDGGVIYLPKNEILTQGATVKYSVDNSSVIFI